MCFHPLSCSGLIPQKYPRFFSHTSDTRFNKKSCWLYLDLCSIWLLTSFTTTSYLVSLLSCSPPLLCILNTPAIVNLGKVLARSWLKTQPWLPISLREKPEPLQWPIHTGFSAPLWLQLLHLFFSYSLQTHWMCCYCSTLLGMLWSQEYHHFSLSGH